MSQATLKSRAVGVVPWAIAVVFGVLPWLEMIRRVPNRTDALVWVGETSPANPEWFNWVFHHRHFVGYRPITRSCFCTTQPPKRLCPRGWS